MRTLEYLVDGQYRGIAWKLIQAAESKSGSLSEAEEYEVWARAQDGIPRHFTLFSAKAADATIARRFRDEEILSEEEYAHAVHTNGGVRDTAQWLAARERGLKRRRDIHSEVIRLTPCCPVCGKRMILRTTGKGERIFACPHYPISCMGTVPASSAVAARIDALLVEKSKLG